MGQLTSIDAALPAHIAQVFGGLQTNDDLSGGVSVSYPIISYKGKTWHVVRGDDRTMIADEQGDPVPSIEVVILKANPNLSKIYYPSGYEEGSTEKPTCYSTDSVAPALDAATPQSKKCAVCPHNQWGSRITENGARGKACADHRRLAVAPADDLESAMLLRVPAASLKELVAYADTIKKRNVPYQALRTKVGFDHTVAFPKLTFKAVGWIDEDDAKVVQEMLAGDMVQAITALNAPSIADAPDADDEDDVLGNVPAHVQAAAPAETKPATQRRKATVAPAEVETVLVETVAEATPVKTATGFGGGKKKAAAPTANAAAAPTVTEATVLAKGVEAELDAVLSGFDDADEG